MLLTPTIHPLSDARKLVNDIRYDPSIPETRKTLRICGFWSTNWIAIYRGSEVGLLNTIDKSVVKLPSRKDNRYDRPCKIIISSSPTLPDCKVVATYGGRIDHCTVGDEKWTSTHKKFTAIVKDLVFLDGKLYIVGEDRTIYHFDMANGVATALGRFQLPAPYNCTCNPGKPYLIVTREGKLMMVLRWYRPFRRIHTTSFLVAKFDTKKLVWKIINNLGGRALLVHTQGSVCVVAKEVCPELEENGIYFWDVNALRSPVDRESKVFRMKKRSIEKTEPPLLISFLFQN